MSNPNGDFESTILSRLDALEARNRRLTRALVAVTLLLAGLAVVNGLLTWAVWTRPTVEAEEFVVRDRAGRPRARLGHTDALPSTNLVVCDEDGRPRVRLGFDTAPSLQLLNGHGEGYVSLQAGKAQCDLAMYFQENPDAKAGFLSDHGAFLNVHREWARVALEEGRGRGWRQEVGVAEKPK